LILLTQFTRNFDSFLEKQFLSKKVEETSKTCSGSSTLKPPFKNVSKLLLKKFLTISMYNCHCSAYTPPLAENSTQHIAEKKSTFCIQKQKNRFKMWILIGQTG